MSYSVSDPFSLFNTWNKTPQGWTGASQASSGAVEDMTISYSVTTGGDAIDWLFVTLKALQISGELRTEW